MDREISMNSKEGPLGKKCFIEAPETHPDIMRGGHKNPYQLENAVKSLVYQGAVSGCSKVNEFSFCHLTS